jgi:tRNA pseudouridine55 synthase
MTTNNGLLLVDKPRGLTSHDVVARVRKLLNERRVGHAGTLDPMATGLLVLGVGPSTRLLRFAQSQTKRYTGAVTFGVATDSLDADGAVVERCDVPALKSELVNVVAHTLTGEQQQIPPMVSALKVDGRRLHAMARQGLEVERDARDVNVSVFTLRPSDDENIWFFDVTCSVGTYVRVLLSDLAQRLGTVGHLSSLRRLSSGAYEVTNAWTLEQVETRLESAEHVLLAPREFVVDLEHVTLPLDEERRMRMGQHLVLPETFVGDEIAAMDGHGALIGVLRRRGEKWKPEIVLVRDETHERR